MSHRFVVHKEEGFVEVRIKGPTSFVEGCRARGSVLAILKKTGIKKLLVDLKDLTGGFPVSTSQVFAFGASYQEIGFPLDIKMAHILPKDLKKRENVVFLTTVAINRGMIVKDFENRKEALFWFGIKCPSS